MFQILFLIFCLPPCWADFYTELGVGKAADIREIKKAYKKLALKIHPDKNLDDPDANEKFVRINLIYEVLKDDDLRKKYDLFGEDGLKDHGNKPRQHQNHDDEFGPYDDSDDVTVFDTADFRSATAAIKLNKQIWLIAFVSARCHHCHVMADAFKSAAKELSGVVNFGVFDCGGFNRELCRELKLTGFPSMLVFFGADKPVKFTEQRTRKDFVKFARHYLPASVADLWSGNFQKELDNPDRIDRPWLVHFDKNGNDDETSRLLQSLATKYYEKLNVGVVNCQNDEMKQICNLYNGNFQFFEKTILTQAGGQSTEIDFESIEESIANLLLPELPIWDGSVFWKHVHSTPTLVFFEFSNEFSSNLDLRFITPLVENDEFDVVIVSCTSSQKNFRFCQTLHVDSPKILSFRGKGWNQYEIYIGRIYHAEIIEFMRESLAGLVVSLTPARWRDMTTLKGIWIVDFFAPWCPPCKAMMSEFRQISSKMTNVQFGTVDCVQHGELCQEFKIRSYPTQFMLNGTNPAVEFKGHVTYDTLHQFIDDLANPACFDLTPESFYTMVQNRPVGQLWIVDFYAEWCGPCKQLMPEIRQLARDTKGR